MIKNRDPLRRFMIGECNFRDLHPEMTTLTKNTEEFYIGPPHWGRSITDAVFAVRDFYHLRGWRTILKEVCENTKATLEIENPNGVINTHNPRSIVIWPDNQNRALVVRVIYQSCTERFYVGEKIRSDGGELELEVFSFGPFDQRIKVLNDSDYGMRWGLPEGKILSFFRTADKRSWYLSNHDCPDNSYNFNIEPDGYKTLICSK